MQSTGSLIYRRAKFPDEIPFVRALENKHYDNLIDPGFYVDMMHTSYKGVRVTSEGLIIKGMMLWQLSPRGILVNRICGEGIDTLIRGGQGLAALYGMDIVFPAIPEHDFLVDDGYVTEVISMIEGEDKLFYLGKKR